VKDDVLPLSPSSSHRARYHTMCSTEKTGGWKGREAEPGGMKEVAAGEGMSLIHNSLSI